MWQRGGMHGRGVCIARGHVWQGSMCGGGGMHGGGEGVRAGEKATEAGGTYPTGMHSFALLCCCRL